MGWGKRVDGGRGFGRLRSFLLPGVEVIARRILGGGSGPRRNG